jgi:hypothetical protein
MSQLIFDFSTTSSAVTGYSPLTIVFTPSAINLTGSEFLAKIVYNFPDGSAVTLTNNFTNTTDITDCRANLNYTLPADINAQTITISVYKGPSYTVTNYTLTVTNVLPYFTTNPKVVSPVAHTFGEVHLLRNRAWGTENTQMLLFETNNPNYLLINYNG